MPSNSLKKYRAKKKRDGVCRDCTRPAVRGIFCEEHRAKYNKKTQQLRGDRKRRGVCLRCGSVLDKSSTAYCTKHFVEHQQRHRKNDMVLRGAMRVLIRTKKRRVSIKRVLDAKNTIAQHANNLDLTTREKRILELRFILDFGLRDVGIKLNLSFERVRQIEYEIAEKVSLYLQQKGITL